MKMAVHIVIFITCFGLYGCLSRSDSGNSGFIAEDYASLKSLISPNYDYSIVTTAYHVDSDNGPDPNDGSATSPVATINHVAGVIYAADGDLSFGANFLSTSRARPMATVFTDWITLKAMDGHHPKPGHLERGT